MWGEKEGKRRDPEWGRGGRQGEGWGRRRKDAPPEEPFEMVFLNEVISHREVQDGPGGRRRWRRRFWPDGGPPTGSTDTVAEAHRSAQPGREAGCGPFLQN